MSSLRIGGFDVDRAKALAHARRYLTDADLLAPVLLNVSRMKIKTYGGLQAKREELDEHLARIPTDLDLVAADEHALAVLGDMFAVLDGPGVWERRARCWRRSCTASARASSRSTTTRSAPSTRPATTPR
jgi:hypothetical protein